MIIEFHFDRKKEKKCPRYKNVLYLSRGIMRLCDCRKNKLKTTNRRGKKILAHMNNGFHNRTQPGSSSMDKCECALACQVSKWNKKISTSEANRWRWKRKKKKKTTNLSSRERHADELYCVRLWFMKLFFVFFFIFVQKYIYSHFRYIVYARGLALVNMNTVWWFLATIKRKIHNTFLLCVKIRRRKSNSRERKK